MKEMLNWLAHKCKVTAPLSDGGGKIEFWVDRTQFQYIAAMMAVPNDVNIRIYVEIEEATETHKNTDQQTGEVPKDDDGKWRYTPTTE